ncbi:hypothetical protein [Lederbergia galactosidilytica]|uniref:Uncharacterized protein n=1 Tax=Lederbergia galactosidilytica TaxID=217031 RepID=A0A0Q9XZG4_9BACI|nr:hypothetical protein [Lederbergia galactosidilytica]KRG14045.1 hypothetical protein ACA29_06790 [Lederbergia galactosidilytica]KRG16507.1 hypothetical protein ACA30_02110 [Virgibacillus soli]MBP1914159.1 hypothetical protein [Lederbergia galactosidilytica]OAK67382.1 hypothetical protein ABB05_19740 [Lederbergia galactosidilytica]
MEKLSNKYVKFSLVLLLSVALILFTQEIKLLKDPESTPITMMTIAGLIVLWAFSMIGILISDLMQKVPVKVIRDFPILGWVSIVSLILCLISDFFVQAIAAVDFLSITTPILAFAGISVADRLVDLRKTSWKVAIVAVFVFTGTYVGSALLAQFGLYLSGK